MKQELSISFRPELDPTIMKGRTVAIHNYPFDAVSVYDDLGYPSPFPELRFYGDYTTIPRLGPACLAIGKYKDLGEVTTEIDRLRKTRDEGVFIGLAPGAWMENIGLKPATIGQLRRASEVLNPQRDLPLMIGGWGGKVAALAGEIAQEIKAGGSANPLIVPILKERLAVGVRRANRNIDDIGIVLGAVTVVDEDRKTALALAKKRAVVYIDVVGKKDPTALRDYPEEMEAIVAALSRGDINTAISHLPDNLARRFMIAGTPKDIIKQTEEMLAAGAGRIDFGSPHGVNEIEGIHLLGKKVLPYFKN